MSKPSVREKDSAQESPARCDWATCSGGPKVFGSQPGACLRSAATPPCRALYSAMISAKSRHSTFTLMKTKTNFSSLVESIKSLPCLELALPGLLCRGSSDLQPKVVWITFREFFFVMRATAAQVPG
jgi:hypothetical protein